MYIYRGVLVLFLTLLVGCHGQASSAIADQFSTSGRKSVDLALAISGNWDHVCILGPYSDDVAATQTLGFKWSAVALTDIERNDSISLLVFVQDKSVVSYIEHPRRSGDFTNLAGRCFPHSSAKFVQVAHPVKGWPGLFPADEA